MDALIYTAMSGADRALRAQQVHANNIANLETGGFRADLELAQSQPVGGYGYDSRVLAQLQANQVSQRSGELLDTGRALDVAISGEGLFAVQAEDGEAYTRAGSFSVDQDGALSLNGRPVLGEGGPIVLPPYARLEVAADGSLAVQAPGETGLQAVDKLKLVRPDPADLVKNTQGLLVSRSGADYAADETVRVLGGHLERSNVSAVEEMVATMSLNRSFEVQMRLLKAADEMNDAGNRLIRG